MHRLDGPPCLGCRYQKLNQTLVPSFLVPLPLPRLCVDVVKEGGRRWTWSSKKQELSQSTGVAPRGSAELCHLLVGKDLVLHLFGSLFLDPVPTGSYINPFLLVIKALGELHEVLSVLILMRRRSKLSLGEH